MARSTCYCLHPDDTSAAATPLFTCPEFEQRLLRPDANGAAQADDERDEVLYVLGGSGVVTIGDATQTPSLGPRVARRDAVGRRRG